jgi:hypothetical protein
VRRRALVVLLASAPLIGLGLAVPEATAIASDGPGWRWPLTGTPEVDRPFQPPASTWGAGHRGVDLAGQLGEPVLAAGSGRVTYAGLLAGRGVVTVTHAGGLRTTYEPVAAAVSVGEVVAAGDLLGSLGTGHASCRVGVTCLHWGLKRGTTYLDPLGVIVGGTLQLLPINAKAPRVRDDKDKDKDKDKERAKKATNRAKRLLKRTTRVVKKAGKGVAKAGRVVGRVVVKSGRATGRLVVRAGPQIARFAARQAARSAATAAAAAVAPEVLVGVGAVALVGGTVYVLRRRG